MLPLEKARPPMLSPLTQTPNDSPFDAVRAERQAQFGVSIAYVKAQVGPGTEYGNEAARAVVSPQGGWYQLREMPEEFAGATGAGVSHRLLPRPELGATLARWNALLQAAAQGDMRFRKLSLYALYEGGSLRHGHGLFVLDCAQGRPLFTAGAWRPDVVPRFLKICVSAADDAAMAAEFGLPASGVQFLLVPSHTDNGGALLATLAPSPGSADLSARPASPVAH